MLFGTLLDGDLPDNQLESLENELKNAMEKAKALALSCKLNNY
jgi:hypothetical protein